MNHQITIKENAAVAASRKAMKISLLAAAILTSAAAPSFAQTPSAELPKVFSDGVGAKTQRVKNINKVRYIEMYLAARDPKTGNFLGACYNSSILPSDIPASKDTSPQNLLEGLNFKKIKKEFGVAAVSLNGPKLWMCDWFEADVGVTRVFNGIKAQWCAQLNMGKDTNVNKVPAYKPFHIARKSSVGWNKGTKVLLLDDPQGNTWIMKGFQQGLKPQRSYKQFVDACANNFKKLPPGWKFRIKTLQKNYIETPNNGVATILSDEFFNVYDKTGPGMGNYKP
ncbi:MAG: hypothetical protein WCO94_05690 [Verrucomicrobiota bacterium]